MKQAHHQYKQECALSIKHISIRTSQDVKYEAGTSSVQARMCIINQAHQYTYKPGCASMKQADHQYKPGCAVLARPIIIINEDVQYKQAHFQYE